MMDEITIIPAILLGERDDGSVLLKCLQNEEVVVRAFQPSLFGKIIPEYILLGVKYENNSVILTVADGIEFKDLYKSKWKLLLNKIEYDEQ